ncbi:hypothetical protein ABZW30_18615 [Kitasatospora sp. NPDC004669]|uniref:hypothetical protein n=1 Tax=Kitasatospora sp. NPDC004669 TaxID=3154555 RepID=UPI0033BB39F8
MSTNRSRRIDRDTAEQLLGGAVGGPSAGQDASLTGPDGPGQLARVLAAAAAPATAAELSGEEAALAAFREASLTPEPVVTPVRRRSMATAALARAFSTKAAAAVLGATALCGVAVAAGTGNLPSGLGGGGPEPERTPPAASEVFGSPSGTGKATGSQSGATPSGSSTRPSTTNPQSSGSSTAPTPSANGHGGQAATPAQVALCHVFADRTAKGDRPGQLVADPQFAQLVSAAGSADAVAEYCGEALGKPGGDSHPGAGTQSHDPGRATGNPGTDPNTGVGKGNGDGNANGGPGNKPGKPGATVPPEPAVPTPSAVRPSKTDNSTTER